MKKEYFESYSNLVYSLVGFLGLLPYFLNFYGTTFCMVMQVLSVGSFIYHWNKTKPIFLFDWFAMVFVISIITAHLFNTYWVWFGAMAYIVIYGYFIIGKFNVFLEIGFSIAACLIAVWINRGFLDFAILLSITLVALWIRSKDEDPKQAMFHDSWEHSLWHLLTAPLFFIGWFGTKTILAAL